MPTLPPRACGHQPCPHTLPCPIHGAPRDRPSSSAMGYDYEWQTQTRPTVLAATPICPGYGKYRGKCGRPTREVDHVRSKRRGGTNDIGNLQAYCGRCHRAKTATEDGSLGNVRRAPATTS
jgi:5-methylcytosine-specific restriction enzyme A